MGARWVHVRSRTRHARQHSPLLLAITTSLTSARPRTTFLATPCYHYLPRISTTLNFSCRRSPQPSHQSSDRPCLPPPSDVTHRVCMRQVHRRQVSRGDAAPHDLCARSSALAPHSTASRRTSTAHTALAPPSTALSTCRAPRLHCICTYSYTARTARTGLHAPRTVHMQGVRYKCERYAYNDTRWHGTHAMCLNPVPANTCDAHAHAHMQVRVTQQLNQVFGSHDLSKK